MISSELPSIFLSQPAPVAAEASWPGQVIPAAIAFLSSDFHEDNCH